MALLMIWVMALCAASACAAAAPRTATPTAPVPVLVFAHATRLTHATVVSGNVSKSSRNPLFVQDKPWEPRLDNGYPMMAHSPAASDGSPERWEVWYGDCISSPGGGAPDCDQQVVLYANSTDGFTWAKPDLGAFNLSAATWVRPSLRRYGTHNNIVMRGGGVGVYRDPRVQPGKPGAYKGFGVGCFAPGGGAASDDGCISGIGESVDGIVWGDAVPLNWPKPQRYDCEQNIWWDRKSDTYLLTTRSYNPPNSPCDGKCGRSVALAQSKSWQTGWPKQVTTIEVGTPSEQLYSQITFPWYNVWLGMVMVYSEASKSQEVHCRLAYSRDLATWAWVDGGAADLADGKDFIPLGHPGAFDSHIIFAAAHPVIMPRDGTARIYYMGGNGPHFGARNSSFGLATLAKDRFAGVQAQSPGASFTVQMDVTASYLAVTADVQAGGAVSCSGGGVVTQPLTRSGTDTPFPGEASFHHLLGTQVTFECTLAHSTVYTLSFVASV